RPDTPGQPGRDQEEHGHDEHDGERPGERPAAPREPQTADLLLYRLTRNWEHLFDHAPILPEHVFAVNHVTTSNWCLLQPNVAARVRLIRRKRVRASGGTAMAEQLTTRQRRILEVIRDAVADRGSPPSIREIGDAVGLTSTSS